METNSIMAPATTDQVISREALLSHWQGHRALTRRVIEAFPEEQFYTYSIGGMRTFSELTMEMLGIAAPGIRGIVFCDWTFSEPKLDWSTPAPETKEELLKLWDLVTEYINVLWPQIPEGRFQEVDKSFGMWEGKVYDLFLYFVDNEIHHRAQAYVYLRSLGIEPPAFWDR